MNYDAQKSSLKKMTCYLILQKSLKTLILTLFVSLHQIFVAYKTYIHDILTNPYNNKDNKKVRTRQEENNLKTLKKLIKL